MGAVAAAIAASAAASIGSAAISSSAAGDAASAQAGAADRASATQLQMFNESQRTLSPFVAAGTNELPQLSTTGSNALAQLATLFGVGGGGGVNNLSPAAASADSRFASEIGADLNSLQQFGPNFPDQGTAVNDIVSQISGQLNARNAVIGPDSGATAGGAGTTAGGPNALAAVNALTQFPGYQFMLSQGLQGLQASQAAQGLLKSGNTLEGIVNFSQGLAQSNAWQPYINQLAQLAGIPQNLVSVGANAAAQSGGNAITTGHDVGQNIQNAGTALASGQVGAANAISGTASSLGTNALLLSALRGPGGASSFPGAGGGAGGGLLDNGG